MAQFHIQAGNLKHLKLIFNPDESTRPTKSIVRGSFFDTLGSEIVDSVFIEAFGGCGSMGIEALSRGARAAIFYEINKEAYEILSRNLTLMRDRAPHFQCKSLNADFFTQDIQSHIEKIAQNDDKNVRNARIILYLDPPFCIREGMADIYERLITKICNFSHSQQSRVDLIVFEHWSGYNMPHFFGEYEKYKTRQFGKSTLTYFIIKD